MWPAPVRADRDTTAPSRRCREVVETLATLGKAQLPGAARALARRARRDRPLGAAEARHRRPAHRRLGAARQDRGGRARRQGRRTRSRDLARAGAALCASCSPGSKAAPTSPRPRDPAPFRPPMLAHAIEDGDFAALDPARLSGRMEMGRHPRAGRRRHARGRDARRAALFAHRRGHLARAFPTWSRRCGFDGAHRRRAAGRARAAACSPSTCCSSGSTARPSRRSCWPSFPRICAPTICWSRAARICASARSPQRRARLEAFVARLDDPRIDLSPLVPFATWEELAAARADPATSAPATMPRRSKA